MKHLRIMGRPIGEVHRKTFTFTSDKSPHVVMTASSNDVTIVTHDGPEIRVELSWFGVNTDWIGDTVDVRFDEASSELFIDTESNIHVPPSDFVPKVPAFGFIRKSRSDAAASGMFMFATGVDVEIAVPHGATIESTMTSGDLTMSGQLTTVVSRSTSGDVHYLDATEANPLRSANLATSSGDIAIRGAVTDVIARAKSGDIAIASVVSADVTTSSGDIELGVTRGEKSGVIRCEATSGDVVVRVARGLTVALDVATKRGEISNAIALDGDSAGETGDFDTDAVISIQTSSGDVRIKKSVL